MEFQVVFVHSRGKVKNVFTMIQWNDWTEWNGRNGIPSYHFHCEHDFHFFHWLEENHEDCVDSTGLENFRVFTMKMESTGRSSIVCRLPGALSAHGSGIKVRLRQTFGPHTPNFWPP
jgi:hypothetical protein